MPTSELRYDQLCAWACIVPLTQTSIQSKPRPGNAYDQDWPAEVDDDYITETGILPMPAGSVSVMVAFNAHTRIVQVLSKICKYVYPIKGLHAGDKNSVTYTVGYSKIRELEQDLAQWLDELPTSLRPGEEASPLIIRSVKHKHKVDVTNNLQGTTNAPHGFWARPALALPSIPSLRLPGQI
jgi:hypothetical protein